MHEFRLPDVGEGVAEGELVAWRVEPGDRVEEDQVVAEVETDKAVVDIPSPVNGTVRELRAEPGDVVPVGDVLLTFDVDGEIEAEELEPAEEAETEEPADENVGEEDAKPSGDGASGRVFAPPSVRRLAREEGVDLGSVEGSGPGGRITEADVRAAAEADGSGGSDDGSDSGLKSAVSKLDDGGGDGETAGGKDGESGGLKSAVSRIDRDTGDGQSASGTGGDAEPAGRDRTLATPATRKVARELDVDIDDVPAREQRDGEAFVTGEAVREYAQAQQSAQAVDAAELAETEGGEREHREPYRGIRRTIGEAMERSKASVPHATHHDSVVVTDLVETRERLKPRAEEQDVKLTYLPFVLKAVVAALEEHPILNTALDEDSEEIVYRDYYNIGVATATDAGLMVPVVEDVDRKGLLEIAREVNELTAKARDRSIERAEMQGGTFTVTNFGAIGGEYATPIINRPETAVLGLGAIEQRPVVEGREAGSAPGEASGDVVARTTLPLSLSIDHRVVDGADAARFVNTLKEYLADPALLLL